ncbi:hypothetical protein ANCCAN_10430 [Ancylostoma caninum]|uniref:Uncharacterized protein n=1 Tax=Ancylostoma caninum TaxID=29170 RepID=A0A368GL17_ANCCA|nr:hypothetical protein ANCCAN_10430 [Ancylostoma caninum]
MMLLDGHKMLSVRTLFANVLRTNVASRFSSTLVIAEHDDTKLAPITLNAITAAGKSYVLATRWMGPAGSRESA